MTTLRLAARPVGGWRVGLVEAGRGDPVVFLHGSADTAFAWKGVLERLAPDHHVLALDFGSTERLDGGPDGQGRLEADAELLRALLATLGEPAHLVAHSYGALLAVRFALQDARGLRSLCLTEPIAFGVLGDEAAGPRGERVRPSLEAFHATWLRGDRPAAVEIILDYWNGRGSWQATAPEHQQRILAGGARFHAEVTCAHEDRTSVAEVGALALPTLVASGANTTPAAQRVCDLLARAIPRARRLRVEGAGHSPMRSHPGDFARALLELMADA